MTGYELSWLIGFVLIVVAAGVIVEFRLALRAFSQTSTALTTLARRLEEPPNAEQNPPGRNSQTDKLIFDLSIRVEKLEARLRLNATDALSSGRPTSTPSKIDISSKGELGLQERSSLLGDSSRTQITARAPTADIPSPPVRLHERQAVNTEDQILQTTCYQILRELNDKGGDCDLAHTEGLSRWLAANSPHLRAEQLLSREQKWLLTVIYKPETQQGYTIPALDVVIGPNEIVPEWFDYQDYDGTKKLYQDDIQRFAVATRDRSQAKWLPETKGVIRRKPR